MTDDASRPAWPTQAPQPAPPAPAPAAGGAGPHGRVAVDLKIVIAVLIGLVSVTGAVLTWRSAQLGETATDKDRQAIAETVRLQQDDADVEIAVQDARARVATHAAAVVAAEQLEAQADQSSGELADRLLDEAEEQRAVARRALAGGPSRLPLDAYVVVDEATGRRSLATGGLRDDLRAQALAESQVDPTQTVREGNRLRRESQRLDGWLVALIGAIVLLTLGQVSRRLPLRLGLAGAGVVVWLGTIVIVVAGGR